jgi:hypothetical protein
VDFGGLEWGLVDSSGVWWTRVGFGGLEWSLVDSGGVWFTPLVVASGDVVIEVLVVDLTVLTY